MAIVKMSEFYMALMKDYELSLIKNFNQFQDIHFRKTKKDEYTEFLNEYHSEDELSQINSFLQRIEKAIEELLPYEEKQIGASKFDNALLQIEFDELQSKAESYNLDGAINEINLLFSLEQSKNLALNKVKEGIAFYSPWQSLDQFPQQFTDSEYTNKGLGTIPSKFLKVFKDRILEFPEAHHEIITSNTDYVYFYYIVSKDKNNAFQEMLEEVQFSESNLPTHVLPSKRIQELREDVIVITENLEKISKEKKRLCNLHLGDLKIAYEYWNNLKVRTSSKEKFYLSDSTIFIQGYVPTEKESDFELLVNKICGENYYLKINPAKQDDEEVPIALANNAIIAPFEGVIKTYSLPRYNEPDPTPLMMPFYSFFFGVMVGDLGYGLVMLLLTSFILKKVKLNEGTRSFIKLFQILSIPTMLAGLMFGSFFGGIVELPSLIDPGSSSIGMIIFSLAIGIINIFFGLGIKAYGYLRNGNKLAALYDVGFWYLTLIGALVFFVGPSVNFNPLVISIAKYGMIVGIIGIIAFSARENQSKKARFAWGVYNAYGITSYIGDLVSFTRIAALCLSGAFIGYAINLISAMLGNIGVIGKVASIAVFIVFQLFNLFLSGLSGYVHSMRLIYVEYFGKFYEGGGIPFQKLRAQEKYFKVK